MYDIAVKEQCYTNVKRKKKAMSLYNIKKYEIYLNDSENILIVAYQF